MKKNSHNKVDIVELITKMQEQVASLEKKIDTLISQSLIRSAESKPVQQPYSKPYPQPVSTLAQTIGRQDNRFQTQGGARQDNRFHSQSGNRQDDRFQNSSHDNRHRERIMHKTICADCKRSCEVPFRPVEGRPIYCQGCFSRRKAASSYKPSFDNRPKVAMPSQATSAQSTTIDRLQATEKKMSAHKKRTTEKNKQVSKKKKSK